MWIPKPATVVSLYPLSRAELAPGGRAERTAFLAVRFCVDKAVEQGTLAVYGQAVIRECRFDRGQDRFEVIVFDSRELLGRCQRVRIGLGRVCGGRRPGLASCRGRRAVG